MGSTSVCPVAGFDFSDYPVLPAGLDRGSWRCESHIARGTVTIGRITFENVALNLTHAEGPLPDGTSGQVFGTLRARPVPVPGHRGYTAQLRYGGYADLIGNAPDPGGLYLTLAVRGPGLDGAVGTPAEPIRTHVARIGATTTIPSDPPIRVYTLEDRAFTVPATGGRLDDWFGLPAPAGNRMTLRAAYTYRMYDEL